jgi:hypothetical protein
VRVVFDLSASNKLLAPSPIPFSVLTEMMQQMQSVPLRLTEVRDEFRSNASANLITPSSPILFPTLSEK